MTELISSEEEELQRILSAIQRLDASKFFPSVNIRERRGLYFSQQAKRVWSNNGYVDGTISGEKSIGKTSYAYWNLYSTYEEDWGLAGNFMFMNPTLLLRIFQELNRMNIRLPQAIIDDASTTLNKSRWWDTDTQNFSEFYNLVRSVVGSTLFTSPSDHIPSSIKRDIHFTIQIKSMPVNLVRNAVEDGNQYWINAVERIRKFNLPDPYLWRTATLYTSYMIPDGRIFTDVRKHFDDYPLQYPTEPYNQYNEMRRRRVAIMIERCLNPDVKPKKAVGRPSGAKDNLKAAYESFKSLGLSDDEIAEKMGYNSRQALYRNIKSIGLTF